MKKFKRIETTLKCDLIVNMNKLIWMTDEDKIQTWLMIGPPDGICQEYEDTLDVENCELWDYVQDEEVMADWSKAFAILMAINEEDE